MHASSKATVLSIETSSAFAYAIEEARKLLVQGEVVGVPTETVYGLAANALDTDAVRRIYDVKGRPPHNPVIVHIAALDSAIRCSAEWPETATKLARAFWPGPLTVVVKKAAIIPGIVSAGGPTVALRWPAHPFIRELIHVCAFPLAAPSANLAGEISPTTASHVARSLGDKIPLIIDGGQSQVGIESTVVDLTSPQPRVLRPGIIHAESIAAVIGDLAQNIGESSGILKSPGLLSRHYAPKAKLFLLHWADENELARTLSTRGLDPGLTHVLAHTHIPIGSSYKSVAVIPHDAEAYARAIYAELHRADEEGAQTIVVESVPDSPEWQAIKDRLQRAAANVVLG